MQPKPGGPLVAACLLTALLAGCAGSKDLEADPVPGDNGLWRPGRLHSVAEVLPVETASADGTMLRGHVYLPDGDGPFATVLEFSPYWNTQNRRTDDLAVGAGDGRTTVWSWLAPYLDAGFAVAVVDVRGFGVSEGCMDLGGPKDAQDARAVVDMLGQQPWSSGNVGMVGLSYPAWMQYAALHDPSPHLKTIIPVSGVIDYLTLITRHGAGYNVGPGLSSIIFALSAGAPLGLTHSPPWLGDTDASHFLCPDGPSHHAEHIKLATHGDRNAYWEARDNRDAIAAADIPIFATNGMTDGEGHILQFDGLWDLMPDGSRLLVGQWGHRYPPADAGYAGGASYADLAVAWMHQHLRGGPPVPGGFVEYQDDQGQWRTAASWPPEGTAVTLHLGDGDLVQNADEAGDGQQAFLGLDLDPVPARCDQQAIYVSAPLANDVMVAGHFAADLNVTSTSPDSNLAVYLWHAEDVPDCEALGRLDGGGGHEMRRALTDLAHRGHLDVGRDFPIGTPDRIVVQSHPFASPVPAGHRLVVGISGGSSELSPDPRVPLLTIHSGSIGSSIRLTLTEGDLAFA